MDLGGPHGAGTSSLPPPLTYAVVPGPDRDREATAPPLPAAPPAGEPTRALGWPVADTVASAIGRGRTPLGGSA